MTLSVAIKVSDTFSKTSVELSLGRWSVDKQVIDCHQRKGAFTLRAVRSAASNSEIETGAIRAAKSPPYGALLLSCTT